MYPFSFIVSLRIWHPKLDPEIICRKLGFQATHHWKAGSKRKTPKGKRLEGINELSYCYFDLDNPGNLEMAEFLHACNKRFEQHKLFFNHIHSTGGTLEYFIGWFSNGNSGEIFDIELLAELSELNIRLALDVYGGEADDAYQSF